MIKAIIENLDKLEVNKIYQVKLIGMFENKRADMILRKDEDGYYFNTIENTFPLYPLAGGLYAPYISEINPNKI